MNILKAIGEDWLRKPITGTAILACTLWALYRAFHGDKETAQHLMIMAMILNIRR
jgi:succinate dehydrogenase hydrophobic anchor subunit